MIVKERKDFKLVQGWTFKVARLTNLALKYVAQAPLNENIASLLRFIEIFTNPQTFDNDLQFYDFLVRQDFFAHVRKICDLRIPPLLHETTKAPTPMAETVLNLIMQPLKLTSDENFMKPVLLNLTKNFLTEKFSEQVDFFVLPSLAAEKNFPYGLWSKVLHQEKTMKKTPWLLYSFLKIGKIHSNFDVQCYLNVLSDLTATILNSAQVNLSPASDDEDSDAEETEQNQDIEMSDLENSNIQKSLEMLNDEEVVSSLVAATEKSEKNELTALCKLCHNLLLSDPLALHHFRLLYTLAFRPVLLHRLWNLILDTKRPSLMGSSVPLLTVMIFKDLQKLFDNKSMQKSY